MTDLIIAGIIGALSMLVTGLAIFLGKRRIENTDDEATNIIAFPPKTLPTPPPATEEIRDEMERIRHDDMSNDDMGTRIIRATDLRKQRLRSMRDKGSGGDM